MVATDTQSPVMLVKHAIQRGVQRFHHRVLNRGLPETLALYFHALEEADRPAFAQAVRHFQDDGYYVATDPDDFLARQHERVLWLSFDDNFRSWYECRALFDALGVRCTFYVNTGVFRDVAPIEVRHRFLQTVGHLGDPRTLSTDELRALHADGHTIGAHTHTHPVLSALRPQRARAEIRKSKRDLELVLGPPVEHFAYPYGLRRYFDDRLIGYCQSIGLRTVARAIPALQHVPQGPVELHRHAWRFDRSFAENLTDLSVDGRVFEMLTGRSAVG